MLDRGGREEVGLLDGIPFQQITDLLGEIADQLGATLRRARPSKALIELGVEFGVEYGQLVALIARGSVVLALILIGAFDGLSSIIRNTVRQMLTPDAMRAAEASAIAAGAPAMLLMERAAAASFTAVPRSLAAAVGPSLGGALFAAGWLAAPLVASGLLKIAYDIAIWRAFRRVSLPGH